MQKWLKAANVYSKWSKQQTAQQGSKTAGLKRSAQPLTKEGYLEKLAGGVAGKVASLRKGGLQWRSRWFVLKDGVLFKYKTKVRLSNNNSYQS
jgi:hypothetical protein